jgi:hypothetical protein
MTDMLSPSLVALVSHILSPHTTGEDHAFPEMSLRQAMFFDSLHTTGGLHEASATPSP